MKTNEITHIVSQPFLLHLDGRSPGGVRSSSSSDSSRKSVLCPRYHREHPKPFLFFAAFISLQFRALFEARGMVTVLGL